MNKGISRRKYLLALNAIGVTGFAGCSQLTDSEQSTATEVPTSSLTGANFSFEYVAEEQQVIIEFGGGADILAGNLQVRSSTGVQAEWAKLGSAVAEPDERISTGATAILGSNIINWGEPVRRNDTIQVVYVGQETPATLGRFTPPESSTLTSTVPSTTTPTPTLTPTPDPTDTTAPSISAFSISNPSGYELRISFESDERLSTIQVSISGPESVVLTTDSFSEALSGGRYTYEVVYQASSDGDYTATLEEAADRNGNDGSSGQSVTISVTTTSQSVSVWPSFQYDSLNRGSVPTTPTDEPSESWIFETGGQIGDSPAISAGTVFFGSKNNSVYAVDLESGNEEWSYETGDNVVGSPAIDDSSVYIGSADRTVYSFDAETGDINWETSIDRKSFYPVTIRDGRVYAGTEGLGRIYSIDDADGDIIWEFERPGGGYGDNMASGPAVTDSSVYIGDNSGRVTSIDIDTGNENWRYETDTAGQSKLKSAATVDSGRVFITGTSGGIYAIEADDGTEIWTYNTGDTTEGRKTSSPAIGPDSVIAGGLGGTLYSLSPIDGTVLWQNTLAGDIQSSPIVTNSGIIIADSIGTLYNLSIDDGSIIWEYDIDAAVSTPALAEGKILVGDRNGSMHCIE